MRTEEELSRLAQIFGEAFLAAMTEAIRRAGSQKKFSEETGIHQSRISAYVNGQYDFGSMTIGTLIKLFPELEILYFRPPTEATADAMAEAVERRMLAMFRRLSTDNKVRFFEIMSRAFGNEFRPAEK